MSMTYPQASRLLTSIRDVVPDVLDCDGCYELISEFADAELHGNELLLPLKAVEIHLQQCPCCRYEYETLLEAIRAADESRLVG